MHRNFLLSCLTMWFISMPLAAADSKPKVWMVAQNAGSEVTDLLVPYAILSEADIDVEILSTSPGDVSLVPQSLTITGLRTIDDVAVGQGDFVIVPAMHDPDDPKLKEWLRNQFSGGRGASMVSVCDGAFVLANAGILDGRKATAHFYSHQDRVKRFPQVDWIEDSRYIEDGPVLTTAGVSASAPASIYLARKLAGNEVAARIATRYGVVDTQRHDAMAFSVGVSGYLLGVRNNVLGRVAPKHYWIKAEDGLDEYELAFTVDMLLGTWRTKVQLQGSVDQMTSAHGLRFKVDTITPTRGRQVVLSSQSGSDTSRSRALVISRLSGTQETLLRHIEERFGRRTANFVTMQLEIPTPLAWRSRNGPEE